MVVGKERLIGGIAMVGTNKSLGQHWLKNREILEEIAELAQEGSACDASDSNSGKAGAELCVEIGPGLGFLTSSLLRRFERVIAVEYDARLAENLPKSFPGKNLEVVSGDFLDCDLDFDEPYVVAGNIPYYITSPIIEKVLTAEKLPERVVLLMQKEVAERIVSKKETVLSLFVKNRARAMVGSVVLKSEFTPPPKVDSQVLILEPHAPEVGAEVFELIHAGFRAPRKKLIHNLARMKSKDELKAIFGKLGLSTDARPGDLHLGDWERLAGEMG